MTVSVLCDNVGDLSKAGGRRNANVPAEIMEALDDTQADARIEGL
jgi:hypothetical protein